MSWFEGIVYGIVSGASAFLPISASAHQIIMRNVMGISRQPLLDMLIWISILLSLLMSTRSTILKLQRERKRHEKRKSSAVDPRSMFDMRLVKIATIAMVIISFVLIFVVPSSHKLPWLALCLVVNGLIQYIPDHMRHGNKDSRQMSKMDSVLIGIVGSLSVLPGISRIGCCISSAVARGADRRLALHWALLLCIPGTIIMIVINLLDLIRSGFTPIDFITVLIYLLSMAAAFITGYFAIRFMRLLSNQTSGTGFAYYSWGAALFVFILYLL